MEPRVGLILLQWSYALCMVTRCGSLHFFNIGCCVHAVSMPALVALVLRNMQVAGRGLMQAKTDCTKVEPRSTSI